MTPRDDSAAPAERRTEEGRTACQRCERAAPENAKRCPECGYRPRLEGAAVGVGMLGIGLGISILISWLLGLPVVVLGLGILCLSPFMTVTNSDVMPGSVTPTGERPGD